MNDNEIPDLVPWDFAPEIVLSPEQILVHQADLIGQKAGNRIVARTEREETVREDSHRVTVSFFVEAPVLEYSTRLFFCNHDLFLVYPTSVTFEGFNPSRVVARTEKRFREIVRDIFNNARTRSVIESLLARVGEVTTGFRKSIPNSEL